MFINTQVILWYGTNDSYQPNARFFGSQHHLINFACQFLTIYIR